MQHKSISTIIWVCVFFAATTNLVSQTLQHPDQLKQMREINPKLPKPLTINEQRISSNAIDTTAGKHLVLFTDLRDRTDIQELTTVFDAAIPQWCQYFNVELARTEPWQLRAMVIADRQKFQRAQLFPDSLPEFPAGFQTGHEMWVYLQPGNYYTRHLLIHEGTHSFMQWFLGGTGAPWYSEGMAELLAVHSWIDGKLSMNFRLSDRSQAEYWGRIKLIQDDRADGKQMSLDDVFNIESSAFRDVRSYAWSWAACEFFSNHPDSKVAFEQLKSIADHSPARFNQHFVTSISGSRNILERDWNLFINEIDFGFDVAKGRLHSIQSDGDYEFTLDPKISWQKTPIEIIAGQALKITSSGRYVVAIEKGTPWPSEADGITIEYYQGRPLGQLLVGILGADENISGLMKPTAVTAGDEIQFKTSGRLCFRINESPSHMNDNNGSLTISVVPVESQ